MPWTLWKILGRGTHGPFILIIIIYVTIVENDLKIFGYTRRSFLDRFWPIPAFRVKIWRSGRKANVEELSWKFLKIWKFWKFWKFGLTLIQIWTLKENKGAKTIKGTKLAELSMNDKILKYTAAKKTNFTTI